ncbi:MAG: M56 family metallopeptidase [Phycisphaerae bacterium]
MSSLGVIQGLEAVTRLMLGWLAQSLLWGTGLALLTALIVIAMRRRLPLAVQAGLWMVVLIKFVLPIGPAFPYSVASVAGTVSRLLPAPHPATTVDTARRQSAGAPDILLIEAQRRAASHGGAVAGRSPVSLVAAAGALYLLSVLIIGARRLVRYRRIVATCRQMPAAPEWIALLARDVCDRLNVRRVPRVVLSAAAPGPFVFGLRRPVLVLTERQLADASELEAVLLHEVAHLRRGDLVIRYVQWLAGTLLFFWPVVAWVNRRIDLAREFACDEWALRCGRLTAGQYARCLLAALRPAGASGNWVQATAMAANPHSVERRIDMILESPRVRNGSIPALVGVLAWATLALTGSVRAGDPAAKPAKCGEQREVVVVHAGADDVDDGDITIDGPNTGNTPGAHRIRIQRPDRMLADFAKQHPTADANGDGTVTMNEYHAFLTVLALRDPAATLAQFPAADDDKDGQLSAIEAAMFVSDGMIVRDIQQGNVGDHKRRMFVARAESHINMKDAAGPMKFNWRTPFGDRPETKWLLENAKGEPTASEVQAQLATVETAGRAAYLKMHPDADTNNDGVISDEEIAAFDQQMESKVNAMLLKHFPKADTNGDGVLSKEELRAMHENGVFVAKSKVTSNDAKAGETEEEVDHVVIIKSDENNKDE